jgi:hypothetical protein
MLDIKPPTTEREGGGDREKVDKLITIKTEKKWEKMEETERMTYREKNDE